MFFRRMVGRVVARAAGLPARPDHVTDLALQPRIEADDEIDRVGRGNLLPASGMEIHFHASRMAKSAVRVAIVDDNSVRAAILG
jgi:hypothetical protein